MVQEAKTQVRLSAAEKTAIQEAVANAAQLQNMTWKRIALFGSRTDLGTRGGDIDLYIEVAHNPKTDIFAFTQRLRLFLGDRLGEQKFDVLVDDGVTDIGEFGNLIKEGLVDLWTKN